VVLAMRTSKGVIFFIIYCWKVEDESHEGRRGVARGRCGVVLFLNLWSTQLYSVAFSFFESGAWIWAVIWKVQCWNVLRELLEDVPFFYRMCWTLVPTWGHMRNFLLWMFLAFECLESNIPGRREYEVKSGLNPTRERAKAGESRHTGEIGSCASCCSCPHRMPGSYWLMSTKSIKGRGIHHYHSYLH
jgi:hypothetical protein